MARLRILKEAAEELRDAVSYIESEREGYGRILLDEYEDKLRQISRFPRSGRAMTEVPRDYALQVFSLRRFRYSLVVATIDGTPSLIAFAHHSRAPGYWRDRLR